MFGRKLFPPHTTEVALCLFFFLFPFCPKVSAQFDLFYEKSGWYYGDHLGWSVASAGDVNGDGRADFIIGAPRTLFAWYGSVYVYSGSDGSLLIQKNGSAPLDQLGWSVASAGDVNGDGRADIIVGAVNASPGGLEYAGSAYVYSGSDGSLIHQKNGSAVRDELGFSVASAGDVNGDGRADFIIGAPFAVHEEFHAAGSAYVYSGADGSQLYLKAGYGTNGWGDHLGWSVASSGDVNGDGTPDFIIGAPSASPGGLTFSGTAYVYSGATGSLLYQKDGLAAGDGLGISVASAGDVNGDGRVDFIIGAYNASPGGLANSGSAYVYSGANGSQLYQKNGSAVGDYFGNYVASAGDVDGDGKADFVIGAPNASPGGLYHAGAAYVYSGEDGSLLFQKNGTTAGSYLGQSVASAGDVNGDEIADFIIGAYGAFGGGRYDAGSAYVYGLCKAIKGDLNSDGDLTLSDVVLLLNCAFSNFGLCARCFTDLNCDGNLTPMDVVVELFAVFMGKPFPC